MCRFDMFVCVCGCACVRVCVWVCVGCVCVGGRCVGVFVGVCVCVFVLFLFFCSISFHLPRFFFSLGVCKWLIIDLALYRITLFYRYQRRHPKEHRNPYNNSASLNFASEREENWWHVFMNITTRYFSTFWYAYWLLKILMRFLNQKYL